MPYIRTKSGMNWYCKSQGSNEALLLIHGWSFDKDIWFKQLESFSAMYRVIVLELPGHGQTRYKKDVDIVEELHQITEELKLKSLRIIGHSLGGLLALKFASAYPEFIKSLVVIGTSAKFVKSDDFDYGLSQDDIIKLRQFLSKDYPNILSVFMRWLFTQNERKQDNFREIWQVLTVRKIWPEKDALGAMLSIIEREDIRKDLSKINIPTLIISGTGDPICPVASSEYLSRQIKDSRIELFLNSGHLPFLTQPQKFNKLVNEFLN